MRKLVLFLFALALFLAFHFIWEQTHVKQTPQTSVDEIANDFVVNRLEFSEDVQKRQKEEMEELLEQYEDEKDLKKKWILAGRISYLKEFLDDSIFNPGIPTGDLFVLYSEGRILEQKKWDDEKKVVK